MVNKKGWKRGKLKQISKMSMLRNIYWGKNRNFTDLPANKSMTLDSLEVS